MRRVDPDRFGKIGWDRFAVGESLWESSLGRFQHKSPFVTSRVGGLVVHILRSVQADPRVAMLPVVPIEELPAKLSGLLQSAESSRELGTVLEGLELGFGVGIVVTDVRPRVGLVDS